MNFLDWIVNIKLLGYEVSGVSYKKVMKNVELKANLQKYKDFVNDHFDKKMIADYFNLGIKAHIFKDNRTGKTLQDKDQLFFGWADKKYQYTLRRQPLNAGPPQQQTIRDLVERARTERRNHDTHI
jgi:hypothetical protein